MNEGQSRQTGRIKVRLYMFHIISLVREPHLDKLASSMKSLIHCQTSWIPCGQVKCPNAQDKEPLSTYYGKSGLASVVLLFWIRARLLPSTCQNHVICTR